MQDSTTTQARPGSVWVFALAIALSVPFYWFGNFEARPLPDVPLSALMFLGIGASGLLVALYRDGPQGATRLLKRAVDGRRVHSARWWVVSSALMPTVLTVSTLLGPSSILVVEAPDLRTFSSLLPLLMLAAVMEEITWSATIVDDLLSRHSALVTGLCVGAVWAFIHIVPYCQAGHDWSWVVGQCAFTVLFRLLLVWLYIQAGRSALSASVCHAAYNVSWQIALAAGLSYLPWVTAGITSLACVLGFSFTGWKSYIAGVPRIY